MLHHAVWFLPVLGVTLPELGNFFGQIGQTVGQTWAQINAPTPRVPGVAAPPPAPTARSIGGVNFSTILIVALVGFVGIVGLMFLFRRR